MRRETLDGYHNYCFMSAEEISTVARSHRGLMTAQSRDHRLGIERFDRLVELGDNDYVERSEKFLAEIEDQVPMSRGWRNVDDVVGAVPNVSAYLAGHPQCMRRRERVSRENAPLTIFMDLTSSYSIPASHVLQRGIVLLALARQLVEHRPVELWVGTVLDDTEHLRHNSGVAAWRVDTAPIDLARAAFHIADVTMSRIFGYAVCIEMAGCHIVGSLSYDRELHKRHLQQLIGTGELLFIPGIHLNDPMVTDPVGWVREILSKYIKQEEPA
jgi:hypothetical protein